MLRMDGPVTMVPRALFNVAPAVLAVLVFLCGTPSMGSGRSQASAASWSLVAPPAPRVRGDFTSDIPEDVPDGATNPAAYDDDGPDDLIVWVVAVIVWPNVEPPPRILYADERPCPTHRPCAAEPRAPPNV